jgi:hypothetical protein
MKLLLRFFLSLCFVLFGGHSDMHAHTYQGRLSYPPVKIVASSQGTSLGSSQSDPGLTARSAPSQDKKATYEVDASDDEDEDKELASAKRDLASTAAFTSFPYAQTSGHFFRYTQKRLPFCKPVSYFSSDKYIVFRVIRI